MKIKILLSANSSSSKWKDIRSKLNIPKNEISFYQEAFYKLQAINYNVNFWNEVINSRKILGISEKGYSLSELNSIQNDNTTYKILETNLKREVKRINAKMFLENYISSHLFHIIISNYVGISIRSIDINYEGFDWVDSFSPNPYDPYFTPEYKPKTNEAIVIRIYRKMSKEKLIKSINNNWAEINSIMADFADERFDISDRDLRILELRDDKKLTFNKVADQIIQEYQYEGSLNEEQTNEDSMKSAYHRAKNKINHLAHYRKSNTLHL